MDRARTCTGNLVRREAAAVGLITTRLGRAYAALPGAAGSGETPRRHGGVPPNVGELIPWRREGAPMGAILPSMRSSCAGANAGREIGGHSSVNDRPASQQSGIHRVGTSDAFDDVEADPSAWRK